MRALVVAALVTIATACGPSSVAPSAEVMDASAWIACRELSHVTLDAATGGLSDDELLEGMSRVYDAANVTPESEVARASTAVLRTLTTGAEPVPAEMAALVDACQGYETRETK